jgi:hypothetical protein
MALTRGATGNSKPRILEAISTSPATNRKPRAKKTGATKANTSKKRTTATGKVTKPKTTTTGHKRKSSVKDKVEGAVEKVVGKVEKKLGKVGAGSKKMHGTDGKGGRGSKKVVAPVA